VRTVSRNEPAGEELERVFGVVTGLVGVPEERLRGGEFAAVVFPAVAMLLGTCAQVHIPDDRDHKFYTSRNIIRMVR
jgi:hypothetical protein